MSGPNCVQSKPAEMVPLMITTLGRFIFRLLLGCLYCNWSERFPFEVFVAILFPCRRLSGVVQQLFYVSWVLLFSNGIEGCHYLTFLRSLWQNLVKPTLDIVCGTRFGRIALEFF